MISKYILRFFFDYGSGVCFWSANEAAYERFGYAIDTEQLPLLATTKERIEHCIAWYDQSLNWSYPPDPGPWRQAECEAFNKAIQELLHQVEKELGAIFRIQNEQQNMGEDPDLDEYLQNSALFKRKT